MDEELTDQQIAEAAAARLRERLPETWKIELMTDPDLRLTVGTQNTGQASVLVEVWRRFRPVDFDALMGRLGRRLRTTGQSEILLVSDYLTSRSRELLIEEKISYIDLTGNVRIAPQYPAIFIEASGTTKSQVVKEPATLRGPEAGRFIRFLIDVRPPYRVVEIEAATGLDRGYVSRLVRSSSDEGLITRSKRGPVMDCDWRSLIRRRASDIDLFTSNRTSRYISRVSLENLLDQIRGQPLSQRLVLTGSVAAYRLDPLVAVTTLVMYVTDDLADIEGALPLTPAEEGSNVALIRPPNDLPFLLTEWQDQELQYAAPSQIAIDCLSGPGRMPAEGEAVIEWMGANEQQWRIPSVADYMKLSSRNRHSA